ncbi:hypothetical protein OKW34_008193 [Paraburkholderia youngii]
MSVHRFFCVALAREFDHRVRRGENRLGGAIVALERDLLRGRFELRGEIEDIAHGRAAKRIDRLRVVADHGQAAAVRFQREQDRRLQAVGVLVFVDQHMVEARRQIGRDAGLGGHVRPVEQQIVVVEHALLLFGVDVRGEQPAQIVLPLATPRKRAVQYLSERCTGIDDARVDREAGALRRKAPLFRGQSEFVAHEVHQVGGVFAVVDRERGREADQIRVFAQQPRADAVKRARPRQPLRERGACTDGGSRGAGDACHAAGHFERRAAREGQQQDALRIGALHHQISGAMRERVGLAGARARDHEQRAGQRVWRVGPVFDGFALGVVELGEPGGGIERRSGFGDGGH